MMPGKEVYQMHGIYSAYIAGDYLVVNKRRRQTKSQTKRIDISSLRSIPLTEQPAFANLHKKRKKGNFAYAF